MAHWRFGDRPEDAVTIEEIRFAIAAMAGPLRLAMGAGVRKDLTAAQPLLLALNRSARALFVDIRAIQGVAIGVVLISPQASADPSSNPGIDFSSNTLQQVLIPGEKLFGLSTIATSLMVTEVQV